MFIREENEMTRLEALTHFLSCEYRPQTRPHWWQRLASWFNRVG